MKPWIAVLAAAVLAGCGPEPLPAPRVLSITPPQMRESDAVEVVVELEAVMGFHVDYGKSTALIDRTLFLSIGDLAVGNSRYETNGLLHAALPSLLRVGAHDVSVLLSDQRRADLIDGFTILPGAWPGGYTIDPIPDQQSGVPFTITIRATGQNAPTFGGTVGLSTPPLGGDLLPLNTGPFQGGVRTERIVIVAGSTAATSVKVEDLAGTFALSNTFRIR